MFIINIELFSCPIVLLFYATLTKWVKCVIYIFFLCICKINEGKWLWKSLLGEWEKWKHLTSSFEMIIFRNYRFQIQPTLLLSRWGCWVQVRSLGSGSISWQEDLSFQICALSMEIIIRLISNKFCCKSVSPETAKNEVTSAETAGEK